MVLLIALVTLGLAAVAPAADAADRDFAPRFSVNDTGDIDIFGNTSMTCPASTACTTAQQQGVTTTANTTSQNNLFDMQFIDVDGDASTFNSSRATVSIPSGSTVLFAGLYWGGRAVGSSRFATRNTVKLRTPATSSYATLTASTLDDGTAPSTDANGSIYQGFANVTDRVQAGGSGVYTVADVVAQTGADRLAGWSLVIAYRNTSQPARNLTVFDGIKSIGQNQAGTIGVSGFTTPPAGAVNTRVGFVAYEGDGGLVGDSASLNNTVLSDAQHPATNFFNSRSSRDGVRRTATDPNYPNQLGIEQSILSTNVLPNNATSATIRLTSSGDVYAPGVVTFATELYAPKVEQTKTVLDVNGGDVEQGDVLRYTIAGSNTGQDGARDFVVRDPIPTNTTYVPGSLKVTPSASGGAPAAATAVTDASGDDRGEYATAGNQVVARVGTGATTSAGGNVAVSGTTASYAVVFDVKVGGPSPAIASDTTISNTATASFASQSLGTALTSTAAATAPVRTPDLTLTKAGQGTVVRGRPYTYRVTVENDGDARTQGTVTVTDTLPTGVTAGTNAASGTGWSCTNTSTTFTCTRSDALAAGASYPAIDLVTNVASDAPASIANTATVAGGGDGNPANNSGTATNGPTSSADLAVVKTASATSAPIGGNVTYTLRVSNSGPSRSTGSVVTDALPAGLTYVSSSSGCTGSAASSTVTCTVGALASGASSDITVVARPAAGTAGQALRNTASVAGTDPDPTAGNDSSSVSVDVRPVDLRITNTVQGTPATLNPNQTYTWLVGVTNDGGSAAPNSIVRFDVPAGTTASSATIDSRCTVSGATGSQIVTCNLDTIDPAGGTGANPLRIPLTTTATPGPAITTSASVTTTETDRNLGNNVATTSTPVVQSVDLGVTFLANPGPVRPGEDLTLTALVKNNGVARPVAPKLTIPLPAGTTFVSAPTGCALNTGGTAIVCDLTAADLDAGESLTKAIVVKANANPGPTISATATVSTTSPDTDPSNDQAAQTVQVIESVDLGVTLTSDPGTARPGQNLALTATVRNNGPGRPEAPTVTIPIPAGTTFVSAPAGCTLIGTGAAIVCDLPADGLDAGESLTRRIVVQVGDAPGATIAASAVVGTTSNDTVAANNNASLSVPVVQTVDLGVTITPSPSPVRPGQDLTLDVVVRNDGAARPGAPKVTIPLPAGTTLKSAPAGCTLTGGSIVCDLPADGLDAGESLTRAIVVTVGPNPGPSIPVSAAVSTTSTDTNAANNNASATIPVIETVDLAVTLASDQTPARPGQNLVLTATVRNNGPGRPDAPTVTIPIPAGTTLVGQPPANCTVNGGGTAVVCTLPAGDLDTGEALTRSITVKVDATPPASIAGTATVATTSTDTNAGNDSSAIVVPVVQTVDLGVTIAPTPTPVRPGQDLTLNVVVKNDGAARPVDPRVTIPLPAGTTFVSAPGCTLTGGSIVCDLTAADLDPGESVTKTIVVKVVDNPGPSIPVSALVSTTSTDTNAGNDRAAAIVPVIESVDLATTLTADPGSVRIGENLTLTATVKNNGPGRPDAPKVTIPLPAGTSFVSAPARCTLTGGSIVCDLTPSDLDTGESVTRAIVVKVENAAGTSIAASATASTTSTDTNAGNDRASVSVPVLRDVDLGVTLTADPGTTSIGEDLTLTAVIRNDGDGRPVDPKVTIPLPPGTTFVSGPAGCAVAGGSIVCDLTPTDLDAGESITRDIVVRVGPGAGSSLAFAATVSTTSPDTNTTNDRASVTVPVTAGSDVAIRKSTTASVFQGGDTVTYTLAARNNGPATARNVVVVDDVPAAFDVLSVSSGTPADQCQVTGNAVRCDLGSLAPNAERTVTVTARAKPTAASPASGSIAPKIKLTVEQEYLDLLPGQQRTIDIQCKEGDNTPDPSDDTIGIASDGTLQLVDITSDKQTLKDVQILQASAVSTSSYRFVVKNNATGTAQVRPHVTCLPAKTDDGQHDLVTGPLRTQTRTLGAGRHEFVFPLSAGDRAIAPGVESGGGQVRLVGSEPIAGGWKLIVDVLEPATVTASLRDLDDWTSVGGDPAHAHQFVFAHLEKSVTLQPGEWLHNSDPRSRVSCNDDQRQGYEGVVASYDLPTGVVSTGNVPMPVNRDFGLLNTTDQAQTFTIDLECIRLQTGDALTADDVVNTATIATSTGDTNDANNRSSARILLERKPAPAPAPTPDPPAAPRPDPTPAPAPAPAPTPDPAPAPDPTPAPRPDAPATPVSPVAARASILSTALRVTGTTSRATIALPVRCAKACTGTATLKAISTVRGTSIKKNSVLGKATLKLKAGKKTTIRLVAKGKVAKALRRKGIKSARLVVSTGKGTTFSKTVRFVVKR